MIDSPINTIIYIVKIGTALDRQKLTLSIEGEHNGRPTYRLNVDLLMLTLLSQISPGNEHV
jgi:hypothetical protein